MDSWTRDRYLLEAMLQVAREEYFRGKWNHLEPVLRAAWDHLKSPDCGQWETVADRIRRCCETTPLVH